MLPIDKLMENCTNHILPQKLQHFYSSSIKDPIINLPNLEIPVPHSEYVVPISATPACANVQLSHSPLVTWMVSIKNRKTC